MPNGDPGAFRVSLPFPAAPSIRPKDRTQAFDQERLFNAERTSKKFLP
jgi:hypothetical protein